MKFQYQLHPLPFMPRIPELERPSTVFKIRVSEDSQFLDAIARGAIKTFGYDPATDTYSGNHTYFLKLMRYLNREHKGPAHGVFVTKYRMQMNSLYMRSVPPEYAGECIIAFERDDRKRLMNLWNAQMPVIAGGWEIEKN